MLYKLVLLGQVNHSIEELDDDPHPPLQEGLVHTTALTKQANITGLTIVKPHSPFRIPNDQKQTIVFADSRSWCQSTS